MTLRSRGTVEPAANQRMKGRSTAFEQDRCATLLLLADNNEFKPPGEGKLHSTIRSLRCYFRIGEHCANTGAMYNHQYHMTYILRVPLGRASAVTLYTV